MATWPDRRDKESYIGKTAEMSGKFCGLQGVLACSANRSGDFYKRQSRQNDRQARIFSWSGFHPNLSWSHYRALVCVENDNARTFYEVRCGKAHLAALKVGETPARYDVATPLMRFSTACKVGKATLTHPLALRSASPTPDPYRAGTQRERIAPSHFCLLRT